MRHNLHLNQFSPVATSESTRLLTGAWINDLKNRIGLPNLGELVVGEISSGLLLLEDWRSPRRVAASFTSAMEKEGALVECQPRGMKYLVDGICPGELVTTLATGEVAAT